MAASAADVPAADPPRSRWSRRVGMAALIVVSATILVLVQGNVALIAASRWASSTTDLHPGPRLDGVRKLYVVDDRVWRGRNRVLRDFAPSPSAASPRSSTSVPGPRRAGPTTTCAPWAWNPCTCP